MTYKRNMTEAEWRTIARQMEEKLFADIPENDDEIEHPHVFSERFNKKMEEVFALFDKKDGETNCPAIPQNLRRIKQRKAPLPDAKLMIRPAGDTPVLSKRGGFSLLFRAQNRSKYNIFVTSLIRKNPHNQAVINLCWLCGSFYTQ